MEIKDKIIFKEALNEEISRIINYIDGFEISVEEAEKLEKEDLIQLRNIATVESIGSSTRIEGATMQDFEIKTLIDNMTINSLENRDEQEVIGYYDALEIIHENYENIIFGENIIKQLHGILLKYSDKDQKHKGEYKSLSNSVVANYPDGSQKTVFRTTAPHLTPNEMFDLLAWTKTSFENKELHPLLTTAVFVYEFLSIHPFQDGNGRLSRLLTTLLLMQSKYRFINYISFENHIELHKETYYAALMNGQKTRNSDNENIEEWIMFFMGSLKSLTDKLQVKLSSIKQKSIYLTERHKKIIAFITKNKVVKFIDISNFNKKINPSSIKKDLSYLVKNGVVKKSGLLKATIYSMP